MADQRTLSVGLPPSPASVELAQLAHAPDVEQLPERHARGEGGKLYFTVTRDGRPLRMRRYVYSECFATVGNAAFSVGLNTIAV